MSQGTRQQRLLEIETARVRHAWAKAQFESGAPTPALIKYLRESLNELAALRDTHTRIDQSYRVD